MSSSQKTLSFLSWRLLSELDELKHKQFSWLMQARNQLLKDWENSRTQYRSWRQKVDDLIEDLNQKGDSEGANWLAQTLLRDPTIANPGEFELTIPTPHGTEVIHIRGCPNEPPAAPNEQPSGVPGLGASEGQLPSATSTAVTEPDGSNNASKKKRSKAHAASLQSSDQPPEAITEAQATTRARSSGVKRTSPRGSVQKPAGRASAQKTAGRPSAQKTTRRASSELKKKGPGRPAKSETKVVEPECHYWTWTVVQLRNESKKRKVMTAKKNKADLITSLIQNDEVRDHEDAGNGGAENEDPGNDDAEDDEADDTTSIDSRDATAGREEIAEDGGAQSTGDEVVNAAEDCSVEVPQPDKLIVLGPETAHHEEAEGQGPPTTDGSQVMLDAPSNIVSEASGNQQVVLEAQNS